MSAFLQGVDEGEIATLRELSEHAVVAVEAVRSAREYAEQGKFLELVEEIFWMRTDLLARGNDILVVALVSGVIVKMSTTEERRRRALAG